MASTNMPTLLTRIEPDEIKQLGADDLVRLLHRLLLCDARAMGVGKPGILVPYEINVPDGGSDGEWKSKDASFIPNEFIPRAWTRYQCKAERLTSAKCREEVAPEDAKGTCSVKARVREVLEAGGCYAFFTNGHEIKPSGEADIDTVARGQLRKAGFVPGHNSIIEFYGCNRIAEWTNRFPAAVRFVREVTKGLGGIHYFTYDGWGRLQEVQGSFFLNPALTKMIATLKAALQAGDTRMIRLTGLSGVGKSRLVYEALKPSNDSRARQDSLSASCIYLRYDDVPCDLLGLINHLADNNFSAIIIIDDCPSDIHDRIAGVVAKSQLSVVTIFHESQPQRSDTHVLELTPQDMESVVESILKEDPQLAGRGDAAIRAVASFAGGFPQIAKLIIEFHRAPTTDELNDRAKLFRKLLSRGSEPDNATLRTARALALFRRIGGSAPALTQHLKVIRTLFCRDISEMDFLSVIEKQKKRKIVQQIADTLVLAPRPLGVALAADFITVYPPGDWKATVDTLNEADLLEQFCERIEELEFSEQAEALGTMLLEVGLPFNDAEYLLTGGTGSQMFRALATLSPSTAIKVANRALSTQSLEVLRDAKDARRDLVRAFELLVWQPATFQDAARLLLRLAAAENEGWANNATGVFKQLFNLHLSGTMVPAIDRLAVIRTALESNHPEIRQVALEALGAALTFRHFSRMADATLGGKREPSLDWRPHTHRESLDYWRDCFRLLRDGILAGAADAERAKHSLGKGIDVFLQTPLVLELETEFRELCDRLGNLWPEVKDRIQSTLTLHGNLSAAHRETLVRWRDYVTPPESDLASRLQDTVVRPGWHHRKEPDGHYADVSCEGAERLASELAATAVDLAPCLSLLLSGEQQQTFSFGVALGREHRYSKDLLTQILALWPSLDVKQRNPALACGLMRSLGNNLTFRAETLDHIANEPQLADLLVPLTASLGAIQEEDVRRLREAVVESRLDPSRLLVLAQGRPLGTLPDAFLVAEFAAIFGAKPECAQILLEVLFLHCHQDAERFEAFKDLFRGLLTAEGLAIEDSHFGWEWHEVALKLIAVTSDGSWLGSVAKYICDALLRNKTWVGTDYLRVVATRLFEKASMETWVVFGDALASGNDTQKYVLAEFLGGSESMFEDSGSPLWALPEHRFREWVKEHSAVVPLLLERISLYTVEKQADGQEVFRWHPHALILLNGSTDIGQVQRALAGNLLSFGSTGSRVPYLEKRIALVRSLSAAVGPGLAEVSRVLEAWLEAELERTKREELNDSVRFR